MSIFALVSQSLQTGQAIHQVLPTSLLDRALYHESKSYGITAESAKTIDLVDRVRSIEFMFFSAAIAAVSQIITVCYIRF